MAVDSSTKKNKPRFNDLGLFTVNWSSFKARLVDNRCSENYPRSSPVSSRGGTRPVKVADIEPNLLCA